jgi:adenylosuccinate synthase
MQTNSVVIGLQWGDEGKGKLVDILSEDYDRVVRYQGGHNAGHTLKFDGKKVVLRLIPSGIFREHIKCLLGQGVVIDPKALMLEINELKAMGLDLDGRLGISPACHLILPYHVALDKAREASRGQKAIGTTGRGIGPCYEDKVGRRGIRAADLAHLDILKDKCSQMAAYHQGQLQVFGESLPMDADELLDYLVSYAKDILPLLCDVPVDLMQVHAHGGAVLFEGAQGALLDIESGTYPFVTSSCTSAASACTGSGVGPSFLHEVIGVIKAYTTRVGFGVFPTELHDETGKKLQTIGHEFGSVTGRERRCGWLDCVALRRAILSNSVECAVLTKVDVLDSFDEILICDAYEIDGETYTIAPTDTALLERAKPIYVTLQGWQADTTSMKSYDELPLLLKSYIALLEDKLGIPFMSISTGPDRNQMIEMPDDCLVLEE